MSIDLSSVFFDIDNDDSDIVKSIVANSNPGLITANIYNNILNLTFAENQSGSGSITVRGISSGKSVDDIFTVTVLPVDDAPYVFNEIDDITLTEDAEDINIDLSFVFTDIDNDDSDISKSIFANTNPGLITAIINNNTLTISFAQNKTGSGSITVRGSSNSKAVDETFTVIVSLAVPSDFRQYPTSSPLITLVNPHDINVNYYHENFYISDPSPGPVLFIDVSGDSTEDIKLETDVSAIGKTIYLAYEGLIKEINIPDTDTLFEFTQLTSIGSLPITVCRYPGSSAAVTVNNQKMPDLVWYHEDIFISSPSQGPTFTLDLTNDDIPDIQIDCDTAAIGKKIYFETNDISTAYTIIENSVEDDPPIISSPIADVTVREDTAKMTIDLSSVFTDIDNDDDAIAKSVFKNTNPGLITAIINNNILALSFAANQNGSGKITIRGISNDKTVDSNFEVTVSPVDDPPYVRTAINDLTLTEDAGDHVISLVNVFSDIDSDDTAITKTIQSNSNSSLVHASINDNELTLSLYENQNGKATIVILSRSNGLEVTDTFIVTVTPEDDPPIISSPIADVTVNEDAAKMTIDLSSVFTDIDNDDDAIAKSVFENSNPGLITAIINNNILALSFAANQNGSGKITIRGTSNDKTVDNIFTVSVSPVDDGPYVQTAINDISLTEDADDHVISLVNVFSDIDSDDTAITKTIQSNSNSSLVHASINDNELTLSLYENQNGKATIVILARSNGLEVTDTFIVTVTPEDDPPEIVSPIADVTVSEDAANMTIDLSSVFTDIDSDIVKSIFANTNPKLITANINNNTLTLSFSENKSGAASIFVRGTSNGKKVDDVFSVTVSPVDDAPHVLSEIDDLFLAEDSVDYVISLVNVFSDIDSDDDEITKTIQSNSNPSLISASIRGNDLTLSLHENESGDATIQILAESNGLKVSDTFIATVTPEDDPPVVVGPIEDIYTNEDAANMTIDLSTLFFDIDNDDTCPFGKSA